MISFKFRCSLVSFTLLLADNLKLKERVALDRPSWSLKSVYNRLLLNAYKKDISKVQYNDPRKYHSKLHGFPFTLSTITVCHLW